MHASEVCGSSVALAIAEDVIALHRGEDRLDLPAHVKERLKSVLFYVLPRMSPDGAEAVLRDGRWVRSNPRDRRPHPPVARWVSGDVDGDGRVLSLRRQDPSGEYVEDPDLPGVMLPRRLEDAGPYYKLWPEGTIENFDGTHVPDPHYLSDNDVDLNRNFPHSWKPEPEQVGAGPFGASEPESRAVIEWATAHPNNLLLAQPAHLRRRVHPPARQRARQQDEPERSRAVPADRRVGREDRRLPDGERIRAVHLRAGKADLRRPHRLRLPRARRDRLRLRAVGPFRAPRDRAQEAVRRPLQPSHARQPARAGEARPRAEPGPHLPRLEALPTPAAGRGRSGRHGDAGRVEQPSL